VKSCIIVFQYGFEVSSSDWLWPVVAEFLAEEFDPSLLVVVLADFLHMVDLHEAEL